MSGAVFTEDMRSTHTIILPEMLEYHFPILKSVLNIGGYKCEILSNNGKSVINTGKSYAHNDMCFPAFLFNHKALFCFVGQGFYSCRKLIFLKIFISYIPLSCHKGIKRHSRGNPLKNPKALCLKADREPMLYCKGHNAVLFYKPL